MPAVISRSYISKRVMPMITSKMSRISLRKSFKRPKKRITAHLVLFTWELLELILLHLDMRTLLLSQRVSSIWRDVIKNSRPLRQALFFEPVEPTDVPSSARTRNPLIDQIFWPRFVNPLYTYSSFRKFFKYASISKDSFNRPCASWRRMLLQQPPSSVIGIVEMFRHGVGSRHTWYEQLLVKPRNDYLRMEALYNLIKSQVLGPCRENWVVGAGKSTPKTQERYLRECRGPILEAAVKECDVIIFANAAANFLRGVDMEKVDLELWLEELVVDSPRFEPKRSGGINSRYYGEGYSRMD